MSSSNRLQEGNRCQGVLSKISQQNQQGVRFQSQSPTRTLQHKGTSNSIVRNEAYSSITGLPGRTKGSDHIQDSKEESSENESAFSSLHNAVQMPRSSPRDMETRPAASDLGRQGPLPCPGPRKLARTKRAVLTLLSSRWEACSLLNFARQACSSRCLRTRTSSDPGVRGMCVLGMTARHLIESLKSLSYPAKHPYVEVQGITPSSEVTSLRLLWFA